MERPREKVRAKAKPPRIETIARRERILKWMGLCFCNLTGREWKMTNPRRGFDALAAHLLWR